MFAISRNHWLSTLLTMVVIGTVGCGGPSGPKLYPVTGTVTWEGEPLPEGDISLIPIGSGGSAGGKIIDGKFSVKTDPGKKRVEIFAMRDVPGKFREDNPGEKTPVREAYLPPIYNKKSTLEIEVFADNNATPAVFDLKK